MKYLGLLFLILSGCTAAPVSSEYWYGCVDTTKLFIENSNFKEDTITRFCDTVEAEHLEQKQRAQFMRDRNK